MLRAGLIKGQRNHFHPHCLHYLPRSLYAHKRAVCHSDESFSVFRGRCQQLTFPCVGGKSFLRAAVFQKS